MQKLSLAAVGLAAAMLLSGCASTGVSSTTRSAPRVSTTPVVLTAAQQEVVKEGVKRALKDPTSPIFGSMNGAYGDDPDFVYVCGWVNGKNSFGGYVGEKPFTGALVQSKLFQVVGMGGTDTSTQAVFIVCRDYGVPL